MKRIAIIVEGTGDVNAIPSLVAKIGSVFGQQVFVLDPPIKAGEARKLRRPGELERFLEMAASREDAAEIVLLVDLDDDCAAEFHAEFRERALAVELAWAKNVHICFCVREFEGWFLADISTLRDAMPEYGIDKLALFPEANKLRDAKGHLKRACKARGYKQSRDQLLFAKKLNICKLLSIDRSFRKFTKSITGFSYAKLDEECGKMPG